MQPGLGLLNGQLMVQESGGAAARAELGLGGDHSSSSAGQRERMLSATAKMQQTGDRITQGRQQLLETEVSRPCELDLFAAPAQPSRQ